MREGREGGDCCEEGGFFFCVVVGNRMDAGIVKNI